MVSRGTKGFGSGWRGSIGRKGELKFAQLSKANGGDLGGAAVLYSQPTRPCE